MQMATLRKIRYRKITQKSPIYHSIVLTDMLIQGYSGNNPIQQCRQGMTVCYAVQSKESGQKMGVVV